MIAQTKGDLTFLLGPLWFRLEAHRLAQTKGELTCFLRPLWFGLEAHRLALTKGDLTCFLCPFCFGLEAHRCHNNFKIKLPGFNPSNTLFWFGLSECHPSSFIHPCIHPSPFHQIETLFLASLFCCWFSTPILKFKNPNKNALKGPRKSFAIFEYHHYPCPNKTTLIYDTKQKGNYC